MQMCLAMYDLERQSEFPGYVRFCEPAAIAGFRHALRSGVAEKGEFVGFGRCPVLERRCDGRKWRLRDADATACRPYLEEMLPPDGR